MCAKGTREAGGLLFALALSGSAWAAAPESGTAQRAEQGHNPLTPSLSQGERGQVEPSPSKGEAAPSEPRDANGPADGAEDVEPALKLGLTGRVFARLSADERADYARTVSIPSARVGVTAEWGLVDAEVSTELTSSRLLRDAFVRMRDGSESLRVTAGQFKAPFMARALESSWNLPLQSRGLVEDYVVEAHGLGGRRPGVMVEARSTPWARLRASLGVFRGQRDELGTSQGEDVAARLTARPVKGLEVGASGYSADVDGAAGARRRWAGGGDITASFRRINLMAELLTGRLAVGRFLSQSALAWVDVRLPRLAQWTLQPVVGAEALQVSGTGEVAGGQGWSLLGGVNTLYGDRVKVLLQVERSFRPDDERPGTSVGLQLAARFK
ncbi:MAG: OprO/OprP family phosphate-selective porin [Myxococcaceae bacterium]|nr:OprO/OprP family phosphate-selective porin [Myxococcaceae bacterium]